MPSIFRMARAESPGSSMILVELAHGVPAGREHEWIAEHGKPGEVYWTQTMCNALQLIELPDGRREAATLPTDAARCGLRFTSAGGSAPPNPGSDCSGPSGGSGSPDG